MPIPAAVEQDGDVGFAGGDCAGGGCGEIRIIDRRRVLAAKILGLVPQLLEQSAVSSRLGSYPR